ncbi:hypothetical protein LO772_20170 [Yinghuangia sp. ASG 101]|uniref:hypothetical protein n=1 Tax=Yinghuangia sp. ASG 101 TaxID=2896848 RepID=UPI001E3CEF60|nr:hypothetical protein [Yinghuangia sp. ASG 101]UGQ09263.1 hypothetical protein LO772_20170 [Yinghuangia sp. ASG 101]
MRKRTPSAVVGAICLSFAVAGCGTDDGSGGSDTAAASEPQSAAVKALAAELGDTRTKVGETTSVHMRISQEVDGTHTFSIDASSRSVPDNVARMSMTFDPELLSQLKGTRVTEPTVVESIVTPDVMYMNLGPEATAKNGKPWVELNAAEMRNLDVTGQVAQYQKMAEQGSDGQQDPGAQLALLEKSGDIRKVGEEKVGGVATTHYAGTVDVKLLQANNAESMGLEAKDYKQLNDMFDKLGVDEAEIDLWIDADRLPVRQITTIEVTAQGQTADVETTVDFVEWNVPVDVTPPPANDTVSMTELVAQGKA